MTTTKKKTVKKQKRQTKRTNIVLVLDSSGSMSTMKEAAIGLFNAQVEAIRKTVKKAGKTKVSLVVFGESVNGSRWTISTGNTFSFPTMHSMAGVRVVYENLNVKDIPLLDDKTYSPQSMTPMRDGIGRAITVLEKEDDGGKDTANLVIIVTDGEENASSEWSNEMLSAKVVELQNTGRWTFALYGCDDLDLSELKNNSGLGAIPFANVGTYVRSNAGMTVGSAAMANSTVSYMSSRAAGVTSTTSFVEEESK